MRRRTLEVLNLGGVVVVVVRVVVLDSVVAAEARRVDMSCCVGMMERTRTSRGTGPVRVRLGVVLRVVGLEVDVNDVGLELLGPAAEGIGEIGNRFVDGLSTSRSAPDGLGGGLGGGNCRDDGEDGAAHLRIACLSLRVGGVESGHQLLDSERKRAGTRRASKKSHPRQRSEA